MACSPQRAQAIHSVDEAWTTLIDHINDNLPEATTQLRMLARWKADGPPKMGPAAMQRLSELAWLAFSEAALRAVEERNDGEEEDRVPCD